MVKRKEELIDDSRGLKTYRERVWAPLLGGLRDLILNEAHKLKLYVHPGSTKMYHDLKVLYWWPTMKADIVQYVEKCHICVQTAEKVAIEREKLKGTTDRQKMYAIPHRRPIVVLDLPPEMIGIHNTFNVCYLCKCNVDDENQILPLHDLKVDTSKKLVEEPVRIIDQKVTKLRKKQIPMVLVEWKNFDVGD
ncbi:uncharacterized protein [Rutidosis leptorrhynchoides]|uniref:uncharacterized protein n=1 Tax=Rutidosis leptorrhynchoides TaxID=125765 RepID=UPI003A991A13